MFKTMVNNNLIQWSVKLLAVEVANKALPKHMIAIPAVHNLFRFSFQQPQQQQQQSPQLIGVPSGPVVLQSDSVTAEDEELTSTGKLCYQNSHNARTLRLVVIGTTYKGYYSPSNCARVSVVHVNDSNQFLIQ